MTALAAEIIEAAQRGWRVFPCRPRGKEPAVKDWPKRATRDIARLRAWAQQYPGCNWGAVSGSVSGFWALDLDGGRGLDWLKARVDDGCALPETWSVRTGGGGLHLYFEWPNGLEVRNSASRAAPGVDVRGQGGYVIVSPSTHATGAQYECVDDACPVSPAPQWLLTLVAEPEKAAVKTTPAPAWEVIPEGRRNSKLASIGGGLRRKGAGLPEIEKHLLEKNAQRCKPPLPDVEVRQIAASVSRYPVGGDDPLQRAWKAACATGEPGTYEGFLRLCTVLQVSRGGTEIALPLKRIAELFQCSWASVSNWRKKAVARGVLTPTSEYIAHRKAGCYRVDLAKAKSETSADTHAPCNYGLVAIPHFSHSCNPAIPIVANPAHDELTDFRFGIAGPEKARQFTATAISA